MGWWLDLDARERIPPVGIGLGRAGAHPSLFLLGGGVVILNRFCYRFLGDLVVRGVPHLLAVFEQEYLRRLMGDFVVIGNGL